MFEPEINNLAARVTTLGLSTTNTVGGEVSGNGYTPLAPAYGPAASDAADITAPLEFDGPVGTVATHLIYRVAAGVLAVRPLAAPRTFNSDGRLDVVSAEITATLGA